MLINTKIQSYIRFSPWVHQRIFMIKIIFSICFLLFFSAATFIKGQLQLECWIGVLEKKIKVAEDFLWKDLLFSLFLYIRLGPWSSLMPHTEFCLMDDTTLEIYKNQSLNSCSVFGKVDLEFAVLTSDFREHCPFPSALSTPAGLPSRWQRYGPHLLAHWETTGCGVQCDIGQS